MLKVLSYDSETSIGTTKHGPTFRDANNDIYTQIWATTPTDVEVVHNLAGFKRQLVAPFEGKDLIVGVNLPFDLCYVYFTPEFQAYLLAGGKIWDCQYAEYILTGQEHTTASLAELQEKHLGTIEKPSRITYLFKKGVGADKILAAQFRCPRLFKLYDKYCYLDGSTPLKVFKAQYIIAKREGMLPIIELYNDYLLAIINMTCTGIYVDVEKAEALYKEYMLKHLEYLGEAQNILKSVWVDSRLPEFNVNSPDHKSAVLFGGQIKISEKVQDGYYKNGNPKYKKQDVMVDVRGFGINPSLSRPAAKAGLYSTDDKVLSQIKSDPKTPSAVLKYCDLQESAMKYKKAANTYCKALVERSIDGVLYPNFNNTITPTGRLSSSEPNMQNLPSKGELAAAIMGLLVAPKGWLCVSGDFSQLEKWVQALVSKDVNLIEALEQGVCLHCKTLSKIEGLEYDYVYQKAKIDNDPVWDKKRTNIKPVGFQMDYGAMPKSVSQDTGMPLDEVEEIFRIDKELYPEKHRFFEETLPSIVKSSATISMACNIAASKRKGKDGAQILGKAELLPIFDNNGKTHYSKEELRHVGYWSTNYGKKYHFKDSGRYSKWGIKRSYRMPTFKNYPNQGGAADVQGATTAELRNILLTKRDKIKMVLEIHDSKLFYVREDVLDKCLRVLKNIIEDVPSMFARRFGVEVPFKFPVEFKIGADFGNMQKYEFK